MDSITLWHISVIDDTNNANKDIDLYGQNLVRHAGRKESQV